MFKHKAKRAKEAEHVGDAEKQTVVVEPTEIGDQDLTSLTKEERLDMLVAALGHFVDDEPVQMGEGDQTVWEVCTHATCSG